MGSTGDRIAIDAMGGDLAPQEIVAGALRARDELGVTVQLVGEPDAIRPHLGSRASDSGIEIIPAEGAIAMGEEPLTALRKKPKSSIAVAMDQVKQGRADAVFSAGHSGAAMAAALLRLGRIPGVDRPAIGAVFPTLTGTPVLVLDVGANVDCRPKFLEQFAVMGSIYSEHVLGIDNPRVGLLNIGEEDCKGNDLALRTYPLLKADDRINFTGNVEGRDVLSGDVDVVVCDGFVGNIVLKFAEGVGNIVLQILKQELPRGINGKVGALMLTPNLKRVRQRMDHAEHGGALLLGVNGPCIIGHGSSEAASVFSAIRLAREAAHSQVTDRIRSQYRKKQAEPIVTEN
jgi:glycerol-3-phosphate acyltransferase PlsX